MSKIDSFSTDLNTPVYLNSSFTNSFTNKEKSISYYSFY
jgi:hypothetical protein